MNIEITVYLDIVFIINCIFDYIAIYLTSIVGDMKPNRKRYLIGASIGAMCDTFFYVIDVNNKLVIFLLVFFFVEFIVVGISFGRQKIKKYLLIVLLHMGILFLMGGMITAFFNRVGTYKQYGRVIELVVISILVVLLIKSFLPLIIKGIYFRERIYDVTIRLRECEVTVRGLLDTGNALLEPTTQKPVTIIEKGIMKQFSNTPIEKIYLIPYKSIGKDSGVLYGIRVDKLTITHAKFEKSMENAIVGIYNGKLSSDGRYNAILHCKCLM